MSNYENNAQLIDAIEQYYVTDRYALVKAHTALSWKYYYLDTAAEMLEDAIAELSEDSVRAQKLGKWLDEIYAMHERIFYVLRIITKDPRWVGMVQAKNMEGIVQAMSTPPMVHITYNT